MFVFLIAVLSGCFANSMIQAVGNTYLRMYLPFMTVSTIPLMYLCDRFIFKKVKMYDLMKLLNLFGTFNTCNLHFYIAKLILDCRSRQL